MTEYAMPDPRRNRNRTVGKTDVVSTPAIDPRHNKNQGKLAAPSFTPREEVSVLPPAHFEEGEAPGNPVVLKKRRKETDV